MNIFISAGDLSGDIHASSLIYEIKKIELSARIFAQGGENLKKVSDIFLGDIVHINGFGFLPIKQIFFLRKIFKKNKDFFLKNRPDKIILTDYYGFHILIARLAKKLSIPVYYYISPQVWASRSGRIEKLKEIVKKMLVIFPFEEPLYRNAGIDAVFVGNPLTSKFPFKWKSLPQEYFAVSKQPLIGLFPGSRKDSIKRHTPVIIEVAKILKEKLNARFILFSGGKEIPFQLPDFIKVENKNDISSRSKIDIAINPSGTVSLENAFLGIPMAIIYKLSLFNYFFIKAIIKVKYITMANIMADKKICPEFIQFDAKAEKISQSIIEMLESRTYSNKIRELKAVRDLFGDDLASARAAEIIMKDDE